ncbi:MaoC family dehydratase [Agarivorans aestuarii]|uniref:MaoC family dehydratase n=1 Tax=Agarivorans aestuarii TaxID=1563703 RepID=A0ABU7G9T9_9ALTE|nr:MaoC family dehydratase [Agarivorans aestuarii]MEE1676031.1 MaoC family dehydratase [Agarivorans aestuarii]
MSNNKPTNKSYTLAELAEGMSAELTQIITAVDTLQFASLSGDCNPVHVDENYAANSRYKKRIAHGLHGASFFSALFGTQLPGEGCVYASQNLQFKRPVYVGDIVTAKVTITSINHVKKMVSFETKCFVKNKVVIDGKADIFIPKK